MADRGVPVLMYHSVTPDPGSFPKPWLSYPLDTFERTMSDLARFGYTTPTMDELADHLEGRRQLPDKSVVLTFDDGYLDNWVHVHPILKRYGLHGVVWVTTDFIESGETPRPTDDELPEGAPAPDILGYLNHAELRALEAAGTLEVQSHASTHTWWFTGPRIVDFHHPGSSHYWMSWNEAPDQKTRWMAEEQEELVPWGAPIYENARANCRRWIPDPRLRQHLVDTVAQHGGKDFFSALDWRSRLEAAVAEWRATNAEKGHLETDAEWKTRVGGELVELREYLLQHTGIEVRHHCWPGGDYDDALEKIALELGYRTTTIRGEPNSFGTASPHRVDRISIPWKRFPVAEGLLNRMYFRAKIDAYRGAFPYQQIRGAIRALRRMRGSK